MTSSKIVPMGNSLGIRIPKTFLEYLGVNFKDATVTLELDNDAIVIRKQEAANERKTFEQLMEEYYQQPFEELDVRIDSRECDWGDAKGGELW